MIDSNIPFSYEEAEEMCEDFEDLVDTELTMPGVATVFIVDAVAVCPYDDEEKERFAAAYYQTKDAAAAPVKHEGGEYDVVLLLSEADNEANYSYLTIRNYVIEKGITYNFPSTY